MKTKLTLLFFLLFFVVNISYAKKTIILAHPINAGVQLVEKSNLDKMVELCKYYNLTESSPESDLVVYTYPDGSKLCFKLTTTKIGPLSTVEVITTEKMKHIIKKLKELGFEKKGDCYQRKNKFEKQVINCKVKSGKETVIIFTKQHS